MPEQNNSAGNLIKKSHVRIGVAAFIMAGLMMLLLSCVSDQHSRIPTEERLVKIKKELQHNDCYSNTEKMRESKNQKDLHLIQSERELKLSLLNKQKGVWLSNEKIAYYCTKGNYNYQTYIYFSDLNFSTLNSISRLDKMKEIKRKPFNGLRH